MILVLLWISTHPGVPWIQCTMEREEIVASIYATLSCCFEITMSKLDFSSQSNCSWHGIQRKQEPP